jgi:hypothetical protein
MNKELENWSEDVFHPPKKDQGNQYEVHVLPVFIENLGGPV